MDKKKDCICINCRQPLLDEWKFCPNCRWQVDSNHCPSCGSLIDKRWRYCPCCQGAVNKVSQEQKLFEDNNQWLKTLLENDKSVK